MKKQIETNCLKILICLRQRNKVNNAVSKVQVLVQTRFKS